MKTGTDYVVCHDSTVQVVELNYVGLPEQLEELTGHSHITLQDSNHCIDWITECKKAIVSNIKTTISCTK